MKHLFKVRDNIYNRNIVVYVGGYKGADAYIKRNLYKDGLTGHVNTSGFACTYENNLKRTTVRFIWICEYPETIVQWLTLSHEVNHTAFEVLENAGVKDEEAHCYYHDYLFEKIMREIKKETKNVK